MKYFSLFSGVGGFELAINNFYGNNNVGRVTSSPDTQNGRNKPLSNFGNGDGRRANATCIGYSEIDKHASSVYQYHYQSHKNYGDITKIDWNTVPNFDLVVGGSPCQDLSVAGRQAGLSGARSGLFFEFIRCLKEKQPANFIWENVKGALSSSGGRDFATIQVEFSEAGYDIEWQVLNAKDFGVPQNRERIFVVGHLRGKSQPKVFPIRRSEPEIDSQNKSNAIDSSYWKGADNHGQRTMIGTLRTHKDGEGFREMKSGLAPTIPARAREDGSGQPVVALKEVRSEEAKKIRREMRANGKDWNPRRAKELVARSDGKIGTLTSARNFDTTLLSGMRIRRLTPLECERLMSWPDNWTKKGSEFLDGLVYKEISDTQRYKMCGNGVVSNVVEAIIERLYLNNEN